MKNKNILISGAGIAGLTLAYWLKRFGFHPTLVEKHPCLRAGGYKIDIRGIALEVIKSMGIDSSIAQFKTDIQGATVVDKTGKHITKLSGELCGLRAQGDLELMRGDLCQILMEQVSDVECLFGDSIVHISQDHEGVSVEFERSTSRRFDLVIGADGLHSGVRRLVFGDELHFLHPLGLYISVFSIPNFLNLDRWEFEYHEPTKYVNVYSTRGDPHAKAGFAFSSRPLQFDPHNVEEQQKLLEEAFAEVGWQVPRLLAAMKSAPDFYFDSAAQIQMPSWIKGRIALVGDAAYAASPLSGQGTSLAIVGAYVLAGELAELRGDHTKSFSSYEKLLHNYVRQNQKLAEMSAKIIENPNRSPLAWIHYHLMQLMPKNWILFLKKWSLRKVSQAANSLALKNYSKFQQ